MATISKSYAVGDTVWVSYPFGNSLQFTPQSGVVSQVKVISATDNKALVSFTSGSDVEDDDTTTRVYTTQALCAAGIVTRLIAATTALVTLDATTSASSTSGNASTTLGRIG